MSIRWAEWGEEAFARGRQQGKPILLSLTASWCHACHRMDEETWEDPAVAAAVERAAVPIRVDADAHPDLYGRYHLGGLPTTALLGPDGSFVRGGTFLSPTQFFAFLDAAVGDFRAGRRPAPRPPATSALTGNVVDGAIARLLRRADRDYGGFGVAPKQPETHALLLLLRRWRVTGDSALEDLVRRALDAIIAHLADARDGGFFRYAAAADWSGAHTEKLALDQAQVARLLLECAAALAEPRYVEAAVQALGHARRRLADDEGRVFASIAADPDYYANAGTDDDPPAVDRRRFADSSAAMATAAWLAFAFTGDASGFQTEFRSAAPNGCVPHRLDQRDGIAGLLRDQALALEATLLEYRLTGEASLLDWAARAAEWSIRNLWDESAGAFRAAPEPAESVSLPPMFPLIANGEMGLALDDLAAHTGRMEYRRYAERLIMRLGGPALVSPAGPAVALIAQQLQASPAEADIHGDSGDARPRELARAVIGALGPTTVIRWKGGVEPSVTLCARDLRLPPITGARELYRRLIELELAPSGILTLSHFAT